jgi:hypothetical protein
LAVIPSTEPQVRPTTSLVNTKRPIVEFIAEHLPEYRFVPELRPNLVFQHLQPSGIYRCIAIQRDSASCGLAVEIAATYSPVWRGEPAVPLGVDTALVNLRLGTRMVDAMKYWTFYEPTPEGLRHTLGEIHREFMQLAPPFFKQAERQLLSSRLLQVALAEARCVPVQERVGLADALAAVKHRVRNLEHPAFLRVRDVIRAAWTPDVSKDERQWTNRLAYDCLVFTSA